MTDSMIIDARLTAAIERAINNEKAIVLWPTLEGRLQQPLTSVEDALKQLQQTMPLSDYAKQILEECDKQFSKN